MNFKNIFRKENIMPVAVLSAICLIVAALLGVVNMIAGPVIKQAEEQKVYDSLREAIDGTFEPIEIPEGASSEITAIYKVTDKNGLVGHAVTLSAKGYASQILMTVGVNADGGVRKVIVTGQAETHGKAGMANYPDKFAGVAADALSEVELFSGATISSTAMKKAVINAVNAVSGNVEEESGEKLPRTDEEIASLAADLIGEGASLKDITVENTTYTKRVYKDENGKGYVAYVLVISANYGTVESETLVHIAEDGKIAGVKKLSCNISPANPEYGYTPPTAEEVDEFYGRLPENNSETIDGVELVTNATNTTTNVVTSVKEALGIVDGLIKKDMPTPEAEVKALIAEFVGSGITLTDITPSGCSYVKKLYELSDENGYIAYTANFSEKYGNGRLETETLVHIDNNGNIKDLKKITWTNSAASGRYTPPTLELVDAFYTSLKGKGLTELEALAALAPQNKGEHEGLLVTKATITSKDLLKTLIEAVTVTSEVISEKGLIRDEAEVESLAAALVGENITLTNVTYGGSAEVKRIYKASGNKGYVAYIVVMSQYGTVETETLVHIDNTGKLVAVNKLVWKTSDAMYGYVPPQADAVDAFYALLAGNTSETFDKNFVPAEGKEVEHVTNATNTTTKLVSAIAKAFELVEALIVKDIPRTESEVKNMASELVGSSASLKEISTNNSLLVRKLYKDENGKGFVAYIIAISPNYGTVETETLVHIDATGKIVSVKKLTWKTSDAMYGYVPPQADAVDAFYALLVGNTSKTFNKSFVPAEGKEVEHVTNATSTTGRLVGGICEAFKLVDTIIIEDIPREDEEINDMASELVGDGASLKEVSTNNSLLVRKLYKDENGKGFVAYIIAISPNYGTVETETLVHFDSAGKIVSVKKLTWKTSDAIYGYVPPEADAVDAFYALLAGNTSATFNESFVPAEGKEVEHVTNATNTTGRLVEGIGEAFELVDALAEIPVIVRVDYTARIVGIVILALAILGPTGYGIYTYVERRKSK